MVKPNSSPRSMAEKGVGGVATSGESSSPREREIKYKGVRKRKWGKWVSEIRLPNSRERIWLGSYDTAEKAARAFDAALFCLRGRNAKFNFAESPPPDTILGGGRSLTPGEIQVLASRYANSYQYQQELQTTTARGDQELNSQGIEMEDTSPSSTSDSVAPMDAIDWSFLDVLEPHDTAAATTTVVSDYSLISGLDNLHEDMYMPPHLGARVGDNNDENNQDDGNGDGNYSHQSFLWNF